MNNADPRVVRYFEERFLQSTHIGIPGFQAERSSQSTFNAFRRKRRENPLQNANRSLSEAVKNYSKY